MNQQQTILALVRCNEGLTACAYTRLLDPSAKRYKSATVLRELHRLVAKGNLRKEKKQGKRGLAWHWYPVFPAYVRRTDVAEEGYTYASKQATFCAGVVILNILHSGTILWVGMFVLLVLTKSWRGYKQ